MFTSWALMQERAAEDEVARSPMRFGTACYSTLTTGSRSLDNSHHMILFTCRGDGGFETH